MNIPTCKKCSSVDSVISDHVKKLDSISEENVTLHYALIQTRDMIIQLSKDTANLRDGLIAQGERNLQLYLRLQALDLESDITKKSNLVPTEGKIAKKLPETSTSAKQKEEFVPISKFNGLLNLINEQKRTYKANLELLQSLGIKSNTKLRDEIDNMQQHMTKILEMYKLLQNELSGKKENVNMTQYLQQTTNSVQQGNLEYLQYAKNQIYSEAVNKANADNREALKILHEQIDQGDMLITQLHLHQKHMEANAANRENANVQQQADLKNAINDLKKQLQHIKDKYSLLDKLDGVGFLNDIESIHKEIKNLHRHAKICIKNMDVHEFQIEELEQKIASFYFN